MKKFFYDARWLVVSVGLVVVLFATILALFLNRAPTTESLEAPKPEPPKYNFSEEEKELMACVLWTEAGVNSDELKVACASVMLNQLDAGWYGSSIADVLTRPSAYTGYAKYANAYDYKDYSVVIDSVHALAKTKDLDRCRAIVNRLCQNGSELPTYVWFFAVGGHPWSGLQTYDNIESVCFQYFPEPLRDAGYH